MCGRSPANLKNISLEFPEKADGITGLSGSGKSSLAFDTIYAEGSAGISSHYRHMPGIP